LKTYAALISRNAISVALKCLVSKELLDDFQKTIEKFDLEADGHPRKMQGDSNDAPLAVNECDSETLNATITFRVPQVVKDPKNSRYKNVVGTNSGKKKKKNTNKKSTDRIHSIYFPIMATSIVILLFLTYRLGYRRRSQKWCGKER
jgi:hypothetical protein